MEDIAALHRLGVALAIGLLVGAERHWRLRGEDAGKRTAGVRTFGLSGLSGGLAAMLAAALPGGGGAASGILLGLCFLGHGVAILLYDLREAEAEGRFSVTTAIAAQATFLLGALAVLGDPRIAGAAAVAMTALLAARESLHGFVARLRWEELRSAVVLLAMTLVALPLVPDRPIAVLGGLNPARVWLLAVVLAGVGFAGYVAMRLVGAGAGQAVAGAAGGLVSSTAVTVANARSAALRPAEESALAAGALISGGVS
ncbi:MAG: MgtC/SapB family protein, partial [Acetobacteraceae bacterium]|nr:MgtC/SapB family protein [Acetobacteraceae bacterium]